MRTILLTGLVALVVALAPRASQADHTTTIFADFPELSEWGHMVVIGGVEYWRPYPELVPVDWAPYANGYLYDDPDEGLVWVSNDPWGVITEHYGYWRHHDRYGYVWRPLYPLQWQPVMSSIFRDDSNVIVGWSPFYVDVWNRGLYVVGWGFDDYYWAPFWDRVCYPGFYSYHYQRFCGWHVGVTYYNYDIYYRHVPDHCYRRDWEYRDHRGYQRRERHDTNMRSLVIRDDLQARRREDSPTRLRDLAQTAQPAPARSTVSITPRSATGNPWSAPRAEKKNEERSDRVRAGFQRQPTSVVADRQESRRAATVSRPRESTPDAPATVEPERRSQRREAGFSRSERNEARRSESQVRNDRAAAPQQSAPQSRGESRFARVMERASAPREVQSAPARSVERQEAPRFERQAAPAPRAEAAPRNDKQENADRVRASFGRKGRN